MAVAGGAGRRRARTRRRIRGPANRPFRGSRQQLRKLRWRDHTPFHFWLLIVSIVAVAAIAWPRQRPSIEELQESMRRLNNRIEAKQEEVRWLEEEKRQVEQKLASLTKK
jgi:hypothetical protein